MIKDAGRGEADPLATLEMTKDDWADEAARLRSELQASDEQRRLAYCAKELCSYTEMKGPPEHRNSGFWGALSRLRRAVREWEATSDD